MVTVKINKTDKINEIIISGHSNYDVSGSDIVCASISSICITTVNAIIRINSDAINYEENDGLIKLVIVNHDEIVDILIENMLCLLQELEQDYKKNIKIV